MYGADRVTETDPDLQSVRAGDVGPLGRLVPVVDEEVDLVPIVAHTNHVLSHFSHQNILAFPMSMS